MMHKYEYAQRLERMLETTDQFARIKLGVNAGSIGRIKRVHRHKFDDIEYTLAFDGRRAFTVESHVLEHVENYNGPTVYIKGIPEIPVVLDFLEKPVVVGNVVSFTLASGMILGNVRKINPDGSLRVQPFKTQGDLAGLEIVKVNPKKKVLIMDRNTLQDILLLKLSS